MVTLQLSELKTAQMLYALNPCLVNETLNPTAPLPAPLSPSWGLWGYCNSIFLLVQEDKLCLISGCIGKHMPIQTKWWSLDGMALACVCFGTDCVMWAAAPPSLSTIGKSIKEVMHQLPTSPLQAAKALTCCHPGNCCWREWPAGIADLSWRNAMMQRQACGWRCHQTPEDHRSPQHLHHHPSWSRLNLFLSNMSMATLHLGSDGMWKPWIWVINGTPIIISLGGGCEAHQRSSKPTWNKYKVTLCNWEALRTETAKH